MAGAANAVRRPEAIGPRRSRGKSAGRSTNAALPESPDTVQGALPVARAQSGREHRCVLLREYFWPFDKYRDVAVGSELERAAAFRFNKRLARELPAYLNRWAMLCCLLLTLTVVSSGPLGAVVGMVFTLAFCLMLHIAHVYLLFRYSGSRPPR